MYLCVGQLSFAMPVEQDQSVARAAVVTFQKCHTDRHFQLSGKLAEPSDERAVSGQRFSLPVGDGTVIQIVAVAPHLREQRNVGASFFCRFAGVDTLFQIAFRIPAGRKLQQCDVQMFHILIPFFALFV